MNVVILPVISQVKLPFEPIAKNSLCKWCVCMSFKTQNVQIMNILLHYSVFYLGYEKLLTKCKVLRKPFVFNLDTVALLSRQQEKRQC